MRNIYNVGDKFRICTKMSYTDMKGVDHFRYEVESTRFAGVESVTYEVVSVFYQDVITESQILQVKKLEEGEYTGEYKYKALRYGEVLHTVPRKGWMTKRSLAELSSAIGVEQVPHVGLLRRLSK